jgi:hypothetical protein
MRRIMAHALHAKPKPPTCFVRKFKQSIYGKQTLPTSIPSASKQNANGEVVRCKHSFGKTCTAAAIAHRLISVRPPLKPMAWWRGLMVSLLKCLFSHCNSGKNPTLSYLINGHIFTKCLVHASQVWQHTVPPRPYSNK